MAKPDFSLDRHVFFWMTQAIAARDRRLAGEMKNFGLRVPEWRALAALFARCRCTMSELSDLSSIDRTTLTRTMDRMESSGWERPPRTTCAARPLSKWRPLGSGGPGPPWATIRA